MRRWDGYASSALIAVEAIRACQRYGPEYAERARAGLSGLALIPVDDDVLRAASGIEPPALRSLDALHLATALSLESDLGVLLTYDDRLARAAEAQGVSVAQPA